MGKSDYVSARAAMYIITFPSVQHVKKTLAKYSRSLAKLELVYVGELRTQTYFSVGPTPPFNGYYIIIIIIIPRSSLCDHFPQPLSYRVHLTLN